MVTLGEGSTPGRWCEGHQASRMPEPVGSWDKRGPAGSWCCGSLGSGGNPVGTGGVQDSGRPRAAWGTRTPPTDHVWRRQKEK